MALFTLVTFNSTEDKSSFDIDAFVRGLPKEKEGEGAKNGLSIMEGCTGLQESLVSLPYEQQTLQSHTHSRDPEILTQNFTAT